MSKSAAIAEESSDLANPTPGDVLLEDFLKPTAMSQTALAGAIGVPPRRINEIVLEARTAGFQPALRRRMKNEPAGSRRYERRPVTKIQGCNAYLPPCTVGASSHAAVVGCATPREASFPPPPPLSIYITI